MNKQAGLWIDHRKAVIVIVTDEGEETKQVTSGMEKHVRFSGGGSGDGNTEDVRDRQFGSHLNSYYDKVIEYLQGAETIKIFGPGKPRSNLKHVLSMRVSRGGLLRWKRWIK